jgi:hypothetical protein
MIISLLTGQIICGIIFIAVFAFFAYLLTKKIPKFINAPKTGMIIAAIPTCAICFPMYQLVKHPLHVIDKFYQGEAYMLIGSTDYDLGDGKKGKVSFEWGKSHVVNQSDKTLYVDYVYYGTVPSNAGSEEQFVIQPHATGAAGPVDFYPEQIPPGQIEVKESETRIRYWLRILNEEAKP